MRKRATGLTSIPIPDVPGSENVEIKDIESEDAEAANHGGFNQMEPSNFAKDLEIVKRMMRLKKKASEIYSDFNVVQDAASKFGVEVSSENPDDIFKQFVGDVVLKVDVYWGDGNFPTDALASSKKVIRNFWSELWSSNSKTSLDAYKSVLENTIKTDYWSTVGKMTGGGAVAGGVVGAAVGGGVGSWATAPTGALIGGVAGLASGLIGGLVMQWNDEEIEKQVDFYNVLVDYKNSVNKLTSKNNLSPGSTSVAASSAVSSNTISYPAGTKLKDVDGDYSYKVISPSEVEITRADGSTVTVTPDTASDNNVDWDIMVSSLNDSSKTEKSANNIFNITKVSKDMKNELIKLNAALNGLGYRNLLIKTAGTSNNGLTTGKYYKHKKGNYTVLCNREYVPGTIDTTALVTLIEVDGGGDSVVVDNIEGDVYGCNTGAIRVGRQYRLCDDEGDNWEVLLNFQERSVIESNKDAARSWVSYTEPNIGNIYFIARTQKYYSIRKKTDISVWDGVEDKDLGTYNLSTDPKNFALTCNKIFVGKQDLNELQPGVTLWGKIKKSSNKNVKILKVAGGPTDGVPLEEAEKEPEQKESTTNPAPKAKSSESNSSIRDWSSYMRYGTYGTEEQRKEIYELWTNLTKTGTYSVGGKAYGSSYQDYRQWWIDNSNNIPGKGNTLGTIEKLKQYNDEVNAAEKVGGGAGTNAVDDRALLEYMTTPLLSGKAPERDRLMKSLYDNGLTGAREVYGGNKQYMTPDISQRILSNTKWKATFAVAYTSDTNTNPALSLMLTGAPADSGMATTSPSASTTGGQSQQQQAGKVSQKIVINGQQRDVVSIGTWGKDQLYLVPSSLATGTPEIYRFDNKTQSYSRLDKSKLGPRETAAMIRALNSYKKLEPNQEKALREYFGSVRSNTGIRSLVTTRNERQTETRKNKKGEEIKGTSEDLKEGFTGYASASTRQSRLDNLRKKGVI